MGTWAPSITAITLFVEDLAASKTFYMDVFRLPVHYEDPHSVVFRIGSTLVNLLLVAEAADLLAPATAGTSNSGPRAVLTVTVDDVDNIAADVVSRGAALLNGPDNRPWGIRTASFRDPAGHVWEIAGPLTATS